MTASGAAIPVCFGLCDDTCRWCSVCMWEMPSCFDNVARIAAGKVYAIPNIVIVMGKAFCYDITLRYSVPRLLPMYLYMVIPLSTCTFLWVLWRRELHSDMSLGYLYLELLWMLGISVISWWVVGWSLLFNFISFSPPSFYEIIWYVPFNFKCHQIFIIQGTRLFKSCKQSCGGFHRAVSVTTTWMNQSSDDGNLFIGTINKLVRCIIYFTCVIPLYLEFSFAPLGETRNGPAGRHKRPKLFVDCGHDIVSGTVITEDPISDFVTLISAILLMLQDEHQCQSGINGKAGLSFLFPGVSTVWHDSG